jgi:hypothetical protein
MPADADEPPAELRIGRWLPAVDREEGHAEEASTVSVPVLPAAAGTAAEPSSVDEAPATPPPPEASRKPATPPPPEASPEAAPPAPVPPGASREVPAPGRRRTRHLAVRAAIPLALTTVAAVATVVALQAKPSATGGEAGPSSLPTFVATSVGPNAESPNGTPPATLGPTPSATSPTATPSGGSPSASPTGQAARLDVSVEAEAPSTVLGGRTRIQAMDGASGGAVVSRIGGGAVHYVRFAPITVARSATYTLTIHYASAESRRAVITLNGAVAEAVTCPAHAAVGRVSVQVHLAAGANTIEYGNDNAPAPDLDRITLVS